MNDYKWVKLSNSFCKLGLPFELISYKFSQFGKSIWGGGKGKWQRGRPSFWIKTGDFAASQVSPGTPFFMVT